MEAGYHIASLLALMWVTALWGTSNFVNIMLKTLFASITALGAVIVAKDWFV